MTETPAPDDQVAAALAQMWEGYGPDVADVERLRAALEAVLEVHQPKRQVVRHLCSVHGVAVGAARMRSVAYRNEVEVCAGCRKEEVTACSHCQCPHDEWPCPTYQAISGALLGEEPGGDRS